MDTNETVKKLNMLMHLDREAARLYSEAIPAIGESGVAKELETYRRDHAKHADDCFFAMRDLGADPQPAFAEFNEFIAMHDQAMYDASRRQDTSLMALYMLEETVNFEYAEAAQDDYPGQVKQTLQAHLADDKRHLRSIRDSLTISATQGTFIRVGL